MNKPTESMVTILKANGYSVTGPRKIVFSALHDKEPQTIGELAKDLNGVINRASIYRVLTLFESLGIVERITVGWKYKFELSNSFTKHHHHAACIRCGKIVSFEESDDIKIALKKQTEAKGFLEMSHQLEVRGVCGSCR